MIYSLQINRTNYKESEYFNELSGSVVIFYVLQQEVSDAITSWTTFENEIIYRGFGRDLCMHIILLLTVITYK